MINQIKKNLFNNKYSIYNFLIIYLIMTSGQTIINYYFQKRLYLNNRVFINYKIAENNFINQPSQINYQALVESLNLEYHNHFKDKHEIQINKIKLDNLKKFTKYIEKNLSSDTKENQKILNEAYHEYIETI